MKYHDMGMVKDGALYQQYKLEGRNIRTIGLEDVFETAMKIELHLLGASDRIAKISADLDLVGWDGGRLAIIEVKSRSSGEVEAPERAVDADKERLLERSARDYVRRAGADWSQVRFDIVSVVFSDPPRIEWFADAFEPRRTL